jgi:hypothetical protein
MRSAFHSLGRALGIALIAAAPALAWQARAEAHPAPAVASIPTVSWQARIEGQPSSFAAGAASGVYFWHNEPAGLSLRTTNPGGVQHEYTGLINTDGTIINLTPVLLEADDSYNLDAAGQNLSFDFITDNGIDGLDFDIVGGTGLKLGAQWDGSSLPERNIYLGSGGVHPVNDPLWVCRNEGGGCLANLP